MAQLTVDQGPPKPLAAPVATSPRPPREETTSPWPFIWTLFGFKLVTAALTWWFAVRSSETNAIMASTHWFWLLIPAIAISGPALYQWRVRRVRRKRAQLRAAEWMGQELR
jgi:FtsH-binding integral membrane protein